jgi:hypothetical protein
LIKQFDLAAGELLKGNPEPVKKWFSHRQDVTLGNPLALSHVDGSRPLPLLTTPHRRFEMARWLRLRPSRAT